jgi:hypothetical protein
MRIRNFFGLLLTVWLLLAACSAGQPKIVTVEVPHVVREIQYVTVEVPRIEREIQFATVEVTRIVRETVVVTPAPPPEWRLDVSQWVPLGIPRTWIAPERRQGPAVKQWRGRPVCACGDF